MLWSSPPAHQQETIAKILTPKGVDVCLNGTDITISPRTESTLGVFNIEVNQMLFIRHVTTINESSSHTKLTPNPNPNPHLLQ